MYWSRNRGLWRKGDTSGAWQGLLRVGLDCDHDALRFEVVQHGKPPAFCHKSTLSCWGEPQGLRALEATLQQRKVAAPAGSYTKRLFDDADLLKSKLIEEAIELAEADGKAHVAEEAADVLYFAMARCVRDGVGLADIERVLDKRHLKTKRRPGNAKPDFIAAAIAASAAGPEARGCLRRLRVDEVPALHRDPATFGL